MTDKHIFGKEKYCVYNEITLLHTHTQDNTMKSAHEEEIYIIHIEQMEKY